MTEGTAGVAPFVNLEIMTPSKYHLPAPMFRRGLRKVYIVLFVVPCHTTIDRIGLFVSTFETPLRPSL